MKLISWNVNGLRACVGKNFMDFFQEIDADIFCIQESKLQEGQIDLDLPGYYQYWNYAEKKGYSGTAIFTKKEPLSVSYGIGIPEHDKEGRVITLEYDKFCEIRDYIGSQLERIQKTAREIAKLDVFASLSLVAEQNRYVRPALNEKGIINIKDGRHPVVEKVIEHDMFIPNDTYLDNGKNCISVITGPNIFSNLYRR